MPHICPLVWHLRRVSTTLALAVSRIYESPVQGGACALITHVVHKRLYKEHAYLFRETLEHMLVALYLGSGGMRPPPPDMGSSIGVITQFFRRDCSV